MAPRYVAPPTDMGAEAVATAGCGSCPRAGDVAHRRRRDRASAPTGETASADSGGRARSAARPHEPLVEGDDDRPRPVPDAELGEHVADVRLDGALAEG